MDDDVPGPKMGQHMRARGTPKKTFKKIKPECTEEEIERQWLNFKQRLDDIFINEDSPMY